MHKDMRSISNRVESLLSANPALTLQELAHLIATDRHQIEQALRDLYGVNFREIKKGIRLKRTMELLANVQPRFYIKEIAATVGVTPNSLSRFVKSKTGCCPRELRRQK